MIKDAIANIPKRQRPKLFSRCGLRPKSQGDRSPHLEASVCSRCTAPWSAQKHGQGETESVPVPLHNHGKGARKCGEDRGVRLFMPACRAHRFTAYQTTLAVTPASCSPLQNPPEYFSLAHSRTTEPGAEKLLAPRRYR
jgi:hypothetical protein